jgi:IgA-specific serine endopeptidase
MIKEAEASGARYADLLDSLHTLAEHVQQAHELASADDTDTPTSNNGDADSDSGIDIPSLTLKAERVKREIIEQRIELGTARAKIALAVRDGDDAKSGKASLMQQLEASRVNVAETANQLVETREELALARNENVELHARIKMCTRELEASESLLEESNLRLNERQADVKRMQAELERAREEADAARTLKKELSNLAADLDDLKSLAERETSARKSAEDQIDVWQKKMQETAKGAADKDALIAKVQAEARSLRRQLDEAVEQIKLLEDKSESYARDAAELAKCKDALMREAVSNANALQESETRRVKALQELEAKFRAEIAEERTRLLGEVATSHAKTLQDSEKILRNEMDAMVEAHAKQLAESTIARAKAVQEAETRLRDEMKQLADVHAKTLEAADAARTAAVQDAEARAEAYRQAKDKALLECRLEMDALRDAHEQVCNVCMCVFMQLMCMSVFCVYLHTHVHAYICIYTYIHTYR